jgi:hypothetical protein
MATLAGQRAQFTWALNEYNKSDDSDTHVKFARRMAKYIAAAPSYGFTKEEVTQGQAYPAEVDQYVNDPSINADPDVTEQQAVQTVEQAVDTSDVLRIGEGDGVVYAYGYRCCPDRLKIGFTQGETVQRIAAQIGTSTPDKPTLFLEIKTNECRALERAIQSVLEVRGRKILGGGAEWFKADREEVSAIYRFTIERQ